MTNLMRPVGLSAFLVFMAVWSLFLPQELKFADDPGVGWHIQTGEWILSSESIPYQDPFLALPAPTSWVSDQWLADVVLALAYRTGGWELLYTVGALVFVFTFYWLLFGVVRQQSSSIFAAAVACTCAFKMAQIHFILRPVIFSFPLFVILLRILSQKHQRSRLFMLLAPLFALWCNVHGSFVAGLIVVAIWSFTVRDPYPFIVSLLASCINPYGFHIFDSALSLGQSPYFMRLHMEWLSPDFTRIEAQIFEVSLAVIAVSAVIGREKFKLSIFETLTLLVFAHFSFQAIRFLPYFGILAAAPLARALTSFSVPNIFTRLFSRIERWELKGYPVNAYAILFAGVLVVLMFTGRAKELWNGELGPSRNEFPYNAIEWVKTNGKTTGINGTYISVLAPFEWGGFLVWKGQPKIRPIVDDRNQVIGEPLHRKVHAALQAGGKWKEVARELGASYLMIAARSALASEIERCDHITPVFKDEVSVIFAVPS